MDPSIKLRIHAEQSRSMDPNSNSQTLSNQAIDAAMDCRWDEALKLNKKIIKDDPKNIDALNRQARVYMEMGKLSLAKKSYSEVIKIDPYNPIAVKNLKIIKSFKVKNTAKSEEGLPQLNGTTKLSASLFLQEPGKTKIVNLLNVAEPQKLSKAFCGMTVSMVVKNRKITVVDNDDNYLGVMPDDVNHHLLKLVRGGNKYDLFIKAIKVNGLAVLVKETYRSNRFKNQPSFLENTNTTLKLSEVFTSLDRDDSDEDVEEIDDTQIV